MSQLKLYKKNKMKEVLVYTGTHSRAIFAFKVHSSLKYYAIKISCLLYLSNFHFKGRQFSSTKFFVLIFFLFFLFFSFLSFFFCFWPFFFSTGSEHSALDLKIDTDSVFSCISLLKMQRSIVWRNKHRLLRQKKGESWFEMTFMFL